MNSTTKEEQKALEADFIGFGGSYRKEKQTHTMTTHTDTPDTQPVKLFTAEMDGNKIGYSSETLFHVQVGKDRSATATR